MTIYQKMFIRHWRINWFKSRRRCRGVAEGEAEGFKLITCQRQEFMGYIPCFSCLFQLLHTNKRGNTNQNTISQRGLRNSQKHLTIECRGDLTHMNHYLPLVEICWYSIWEKKSLNDTLGK
eukprot:sb/3476040/